MRVLLPPSEGKATGGEGPSLDLAALSFPKLTPTRRRVLSALRRVSARRAATALATLGLSAGQADELERNRNLLTSGTLPVALRYTGVLYDELGLGTLPPDAAERARTSVIVFSGLWGALRVADPIPAYRLSIGVTLPPLGPLASRWRPAITAIEPELAGEGDELVLDLRSSPYAAAWRPAGALAERVVTVRVLAERILDGAPQRSIVSHHNKATKGRLARDLLVAGAQPRTAKDLCAALTELGHTVEGPGEQIAGRPSAIDVIVPG